MKFKRPVSLDKGKVDITPLVDVVFLLLIFFLFTSPLASRHGIKVNLPEVEKSERVTPRLARITINEFDEIFLDDTRVTVTDLSDRMQGMAEKEVLIEGDRNASLGMVIRVWDVCRNAGVQRLNIRTGVRKE